MAKKRRLQSACEFCRKRFPTPQAKWGHAPHCAARRLSQQPGTQAGAEAPPSTHADRESRRPGPDSQEMKLLLLDTHEEIIQLQTSAGTCAWCAQWPARADPVHEKGHATPEEWAGLYQDLGDIERDLDQMVGRLRLDRSLLFNIYHRMLTVRDAWLIYRARDFTREGEVTPDGEDVLRTEQARFVDLMLKIKRMLVAAREGTVRGTY